MATFENTTTKQVDDSGPVPAQSSVSTMMIVPATTEEALDEIGDPDPPPDGAIVELVTQYKKDVDSYAREMLEAFKKTDLRVEWLCLKFTATLTAKKTKALSRATELKWFEFLIARNFYVKREQGYLRKKAISECLTNHHLLELGIHTSPLMEPVRKRTGIIPLPKEIREFCETRSHMPLRLEQFTFCRTRIVPCEMQNIRLRRLMLSHMSLDLKYRGSQYLTQQDPEQGCKMSF
ncbi:hypothetical protein BWQ96_03517 [Gracilariopsis chorda]|uniref:Uncharacterized protein n=1 Tax=Gracilariopsis chorda TaxID=448386 RepID=A0A2V3IX52_9FLOR|nr:hypothetical protein BWQ96_03517 [Gracilariopsis chorda]|eukprot:PXF46691.1 hypothetical protein BWQ96_03517 [Gracilariopsis chorda]